MKTTISFLTFFLFVVAFSNAQNKYKRMYPLKIEHFHHAATFTAGNAIIYIDRDSLIDNLLYMAKYSDNYEFIKKRIKSAAEIITASSKKGDTTNISSLIMEQEIIDK